MAGYAYLRDVLERLPTQQASRIDELLPHRWPPPLERAANTVTFQAPRT